MRLSVSKLESYRRFRDYDYVTYHEVMESLRGTAPTTDKMFLGRALHDIAEGNRVVVENSYEVRYPDLDGVIFYDKASVDAFLKSMPKQGVRELAAPPLHVDDVLITARVDWIHGRTIRDLKTTQSTPPWFDKYQGSYQWRFYLLMMNCDRFVYDVVGLKLGQSGYVIRGSRSFVLYAYEGMREDCEALVRDCKDFCLENGVFDEGQEPARSGA